MNITLLIGSLSCGGAERVVANLGNYLSEKGHKVTILAVSDKQDYRIEKTINYIILNKNNAFLNCHFFRKIKCTLKLIRFFRKNNTDIYVTFLPELNILTLLFRFIIKKPIILAERADPNVFYNKSFVNKLIFKFLYSKASGYVFQTVDAKKIYESKKIDVTNSVIIPNAINKEFLNFYANDKKEKIIISAGRLTKQKNFELLIKSFYLVKDELPGYKLNIYGNGSEKSNLLNLIKEFQMEELVNIYDFTNNLKYELAKSSLFVLSSNYEGMPNVLIEAMALGLPVIATNCPVGGPNYLIKNGENGILVPVDDPIVLSKSILFLLKNKEKALCIGKSASKIREKLNPEGIYSSWEKFLIDNLKE